MHLVRAVGEAQRARVRVAYAPAGNRRTGRRRRGPGSPSRSPGRPCWAPRTLIMAISLARDLVADRVHHVGGLERQQARLVDHDARLGDALLRHGLLGDRLAEGDARARRACTSARARARPRR